MERDGVLEFICPVCGKARKAKKDIFEIRKLKCNYCLAKETRKATCLKKFGAPSTFQAKQIQDKIKQMNLDRYGAEIPITTKQIQEKRKQTCLAKFGVDHPWKNKDVKQKRIQKNFEKYGVENISQLKSVKLKKEQTCLGHFGEKYPMQSQIVKDTYESNSLKKYGVDHPWKDKVVREKIKQTNLEKYGCENPSTSEQVKLKKEQTCMKHYGVRNFSQSPEAQSFRKVRYSCLGETFDSLPELCFYLHCLNSGLNIKRSKTSFHYFDPDTNKEHLYFPDFEVVENYSIKYFEIKGEQFTDKKHCWINPYDRSQDKLYEAKHQCALKNNVIILYSKDYQKYIDEAKLRYGEQYLKECKIED